jgi:exonuclease SbcC
MIPTSISLLNFMCYRGDGAAGDTPPLNLDGLHVVCLSGENGAGKSALLDAITWALWGEARMPDDDLIAQGASEMRVELEFLLGEQCYRVRRARQRGGTGKRGGQTPGKSQLDFQVKDGPGWRTLSELTVRETQARIDDLLRMSYQTFINASFLLQGRADEFTARTPAERKQVLAEILDLGEYAELEGSAKERAKALDDRLKGLRGELEQLRQQASQLSFWSEQVAQAESKVAALRAQAEGAEVEQRAAARRMGELEQQAARRKELLRGLDGLRAEQARREAEIVQLKAAIAQAEQLIGRRDAIAAGLDALAAARATIDRLDSMRDRFEELSARHAELRQQFADAKTALRERLQHAEARQATLTRQAERRDVLRRDLEVLGERLNALKPVAAEHAQRAEERQAIAQRSNQMDELLRRRDALTAKIRLRMDSLVAARENHRQSVARLDAQLADATRWRADLDAAQADQQALAAAEGRLAELREREQADVEHVSAQRAACQSAQSEAEKLKRNKTLLDDDAGICPVCRSPLGVDGLAEAQRHYDEEIAALRGAYAAAKKSADQSEARLKETRAAVGEETSAIDSLRRSAARAEALERQLERAATWQAEADKLRREHDELRAQIEAQEFEPEAQAELVEVSRQLADLGDAAELAELRRLVEERLGDLERQLQERGQLEGKSHAYREELERIEQELAALPALTDETAELQRVIKGNEFAHEIRDEGQRVGAEIEALGYRRADHDAAREQERGLRAWEEQDRALAVAEQGYNRDLTILQQAEELQARTAAQVEAATREDALLAEELRELPQAQARVEQSERLLRERQEALQNAQKDLGEKQGYMRRAQADADKLERLADEERALIERHGVFAELAEAFGKKGVQAMLIDTAIPQIEDEANRLLGRMTDNQMHLSLDTQRDTKKGDTVETLEIRISDALGTRAYDAFSGGEAMRVNFAVRIALSRLLARRAGARLETLVIDEGFGTLDANGRERMVEAITSVQEDFRRIIVITHIDELKERFPAQIEITKTPAGSVWELR